MYVCICVCRVLTTLVSTQRYDLTTVQCLILVHPLAVLVYSMPCVRTASPGSRLVEVVSMRVDAPPSPPPAPPPLPLLSGDRESWAEEVGERIEPGRGWGQEGTLTGQLCQCVAP